MPTTTDPISSKFNRQFSASTDPKLRELQQQTVEFLGTSELPEPKKKALLAILSYLTMAQLRPIFDGLQKEQAVKNKPQKITKAQYKEAKHKIEKIKRAAWKQAESDNTPSKDELEQKLSEDLSHTET